MLNNLEIEIKKREKQENVFVFTSEDNNRKRTYLIYSLELKRKLREMAFSAFPFRVSISDQCQAEYGVENTKTRDKIVYQTGKEKKPDKLVLISGKYSKAITDGNEELLKQQEIEKQKKEKIEQKRIDFLWEKELKRRAIPASAKVDKHYFCLKGKEGEIVEESVYIKVINQSSIQENNNSKEKFIGWQVVPPKS